MKTQSKEYRKLENVEPFNGYLFRSCYYHQLIAAYAHFGIDKNFIMMNYLPLYSYDPKTEGYAVKDLELFSPSEMEEYTGIRVTAKRDSANVVRDTLYHLRRDRPVIVAVDAPLLPYRKDVYQKLPTIHYLLLYGFDLGAKEFIAMEHMYLNSQIYRESRIGFELLETAFRGAVRSFGKENQRMVVAVQRIQKKTDVRPLVIGKNYSEEITASYSILKKLIAHLSEIYDREAGYFENAAPLPVFYGEYAHRKRIQKHCLDRCLKDKQLSALIDRIIDNISIVLGVTQKSIVMRRYDKQLGAKIKGRLEEILSLEKSVHDTMSHFYRKGRQLWE